MGRYRLRPAWHQRMHIHDVQDLHLTATTTAPGETVTITRMTPSVNTMIVWGDGNSEIITAGSVAALNHVYAAAGIYRVVVRRARVIQQVRLDNAKLGGLNTRELAASPITYFSVSLITGSAINSVDMVAWRPADWRLYTMPAGTYTINSANMVAWTPTYWELRAMLAGTYTINSVNMVAWTPTYWILRSMPAAGSSYTFAASCMRNWAAVIDIRCNDLGLLQATVNAILYDIWMGFAARTGVAGNIAVGGTNQAPSGVFQAAAACPVTVATPGKEVAHELLNDTCAVAANHWAAVTFTA